MNADALLLYSYLMRQDIPFTRFCHPAYRDRTQWSKSQILQSCGKILTTPLKWGTIEESVFSEAFSG